MFSIKGKWLSLHQDFITFRKVGKRLLLLVVVCLQCATQLQKFFFYLVSLLFCQSSDSTLRNGSGWLSG